MLEVRDKIQDIARDLQGIAKILSLMGVSLKEVALGEKEMWFLSDCLEQLALSLEELEESLCVREKS